MKKLFFIGGGKMATAIAGGLVTSGRFDAADISFFDTDAEASVKFTENTGIMPARSAAEGIRDAETVLIAVKPQAITSALDPYRNELSDKLIISIAAGITVEKLTAVTNSRRIIRVMPNTPALIGRGASVYAVSSDVSENDEKLAENIFSSVGIVLKSKESDLDAVTALSGSGPAYVFEFIQALADGGVAEGLTRDTALTLAVQTVLGAAEMVVKTGKHPAVLKDQVTSPAGTTARALEELAAKGFSGCIIKAVRAASLRSKELGKY